MVDRLGFVALIAALILVMIGLDYIGLRLPGGTDEVVRPW